MLLPSERHRPEDRDPWAELEAADRLNYGLRRVEEKADRAVELIRDFAASGPCYAAVSWGKDSTALAHLVWLADPSIPLANVAQHGLGYDTGIPEVRDAFLPRFPLAYHEENVPLEAIPDDGGKSPALATGIKRLAERFGTGRYIGGIRADESGVRKIGMRHRGLATENTCQPLGWWAVEDVFAYLAHHDLPTHPAYAMLGGGRWDRKHIRVSTIGGPKGTQFGRREWEVEYYGDVIRRIEAG